MLELFSWSAKIAKRAGFSLRTDLSTGILRNSRKISPRTAWGEGVIPTRVVVLRCSELLPVLWAMSITVISQY